MLNASVDCWKCFESFDQFLLYFFLQSYALSWSLLKQIGNTLWSLGYRWHRSIFWIWDVLKCISTLKGQSIQLPTIPKLSLTNLWVLVKVGIKGKCGKSILFLFEFKCIKCMILTKVGTPKMANIVERSEYNFLQVKRIHKSNATRNWKFRHGPLHFPKLQTIRTCIYKKLRQGTYNEKDPQILCNYTSA